MTTATNSGWNGGKPRVAIIGGGIAGIGAAWQLRDSHQVTLFEAGATPGGHAHAIEAEPGIWLDTGFIIFNTSTYPRFIDFLTELGVREQARGMTMSFTFSDDDRRLHYAIHKGLGGLFPSLSNLWNRDLYNICFDLLKFRKQALAELGGAGVPPLSLKDYFAGYSAPFRENFLLPMTMAIWSMPEQQLDDFPASTLLEFMQNHSLLRGHEQDYDDSWLSFAHSSRVYIEAFRSRFAGELRLSTPIQRVERHADGATIVTASGESLAFDQVILATHADTALRLLADPTPLETRLLGAWRYQPNRVTIHTDTGMMPDRRKLWSSWNILRRQGAYQVGYYLNGVQNLSARRDYFLSLGETPIAEQHVLARFDYAHPVFDFAALATRAELPQLNAQPDRPQSAFCGSYFGYGFHEDALCAAIAASRALLPARVPS